MRGIILIQITDYSNIDPRKLMNLYLEANIENTDFFYPDMEDKKLALEKVETDFLNYIKTDFFSCPNNAYWVLKENDVWVSALRLYKIKEQLYYIEALETHPNYRRKGHAYRLLSGVIEELKNHGAFRLCDCVSKKNIASLKTHEKCGFVIAADAGYDYLLSETDDRDYGMEYSYQSKDSIGI